MVYFHESNYILKYQTVLISSILHCTLKSHGTLKTVVEVGMLQGEVEDPPADVVLVVSGKRGTPQPPPQV